MVYGVRNHKLHFGGAATPFRKSPNGGAAMTPRYLVIHYTASDNGAGAVTWLCNPQAQASAHLVVDLDGSVTQLMDFNRVAWHAGKSEWGGLIGLNRHSIGIEVVNAGMLNRNGAGKWVSWTNHAVPDEDVIVAGHKNGSAPTGWRRFTQEQVEATAQIGLVLREKYGLLDVIGHDDISPGRKVDPGPAFPMTSVQSRIMGRGD